MLMATGHSGLIMAILCKVDNGYPEGGYAPDSWRKKRLLIMSALSTASIFYLY
jgi:hypothetical protein